jgi:hypothetical protein
VYQDGGRIPDLNGLASAFTPEYAPEETFEIAQKLYAAFALIWLSPAWRTGGVEQGYQQDAPAGGCGPRSENVGFAPGSGSFPRQMAHPGAICT